MKADESAEARGGIVPRAVSKEAGSSERTAPFLVVAKPLVGSDYEQPDVAPHEVHLRQVPLRTIVIIPQASQGTPS